MLTKIDLCLMCTNSSVNNITMRIFHNLENLTQSMKVQFKSIQKIVIDEKSFQYIWKEKAENVL